MNFCSERILMKKAHWEVWFHIRKLWNRLDTINDTDSEVPRSRERYHPINATLACTPEKRPEILLHLRNGDPKLCMVTDPRNNQWRDMKDKRISTGNDLGTRAKHPRRPGNNAYYRGRFSRSPPTSGVEWRPINRTRESEASHGLLKKRNVTDEPSRRSGEKAHEEETAGRNTSETRGLEPEPVRLPRQEDSNWEREQRMDPPPTGMDIATLDKNQDQDLVQKKH